MHDEVVLKLRLNPLSPNVETFGDLTIQVHVPYSKTSVNIMVHPNIVEYDEQPSEGVRQVYVSAHTPETQILEFNLKDKAEHRILVSGKSYVFLLQQIGEELVEGIASQKFMFFEFFVRKE